MWEIYYKSQNLFITKISIGTNNPSQSMLFYVGDYITQSWIQKKEHKGLSLM